MPQLLGEEYNPHTGSDKRLTWDMFANKYKWKKGWQKVRLYGLVYSDARHNNIKTKTGKAYNEFCLGYDVDNDRFFGDRRDRCDCCALDMPHQIRRFVNVLAIDDWERRPAVQQSDWNPFFLMEMSPSLHDAIMGLKSHPLNSTGANVGDPLKGAIIGINYNPDAPSPAQMFSVSIISAGHRFDEDMLKFSFPQSTPQGKREARRNEGNMPAAWVYYPCRNSKDDMQRSLRNHGYYGKSEGGGFETNAGVEAKGKALLNELSGLVRESPAPAGGVAQLAKLREESNGADPTPPPRAAKPAPAEAVEAVDEIPF